MHTIIGRYTAVIPPTLLALAVLLCRSAAGEQWILVTGDGAVEAGAVLPAKDGASLAVTGPSGKETTVPVDGCLGLMRKTRARPELGRGRDTRVGIELHSGDIIRAADISFKNGTLAARHPVWKELSFPAAAVRRIRVRPAADLPSLSPSFSGVRFTNGDDVSGKVVSVVGETILVEVEGVGKLPVEGLDSVADIVLASAGKSKKEPSSNAGGTVTVLCRSGDAVKGTLLGGGWTVRTSWRREPVTIAPGQVKSVAFRGGHAFLSDIGTAGEQQTPWIDSIRPWRADASLDGGPMTVGGYRALKGLAMDSRTVLKFSVGSLSGAPLRFCCMLGVDAASFPGSGDADFVVAADGKELEKKRVVSGRDPQPFYTDVPAGTKTLTVTLDYGRRGSLGDFVNAMWAALVKLSPPPEPEPETPPDAPAPAPAGE